ncbi:MAG: phage terminase large subunit family protein, partial [Candidatus Omnitrophica bacterium]|nr:phage terminase large subunit family protein [Candidatus Omnitrophota bacterium]
MPKQKTMPVIWSPAVREAWELPEEVTVSEWSDKNRILDPMTSAEPGQWRTERTPYLRGIMDAFVNPLVEKITVMASTQVGKTECMLNMLGYAIDQDPGPTLLVAPREPDAKTFSATRVKPMILLSAALKEHRTSESDDLTKMQMKLDRMYAYFACANSPAGLSGKPVRYLFRDETDKYPKFSGEEADPLELSSERTRTFWNRKIIDCSTPTTESGYINREYDRSDKRRYYVPCPYCRGYQVLYKNQIKVPETERDPERIKQLRIAWYECIYCKGRIVDTMKQQMLLDGVWLPECVHLEPGGKLPEKLDIPQVSHVGFHINAIYSPWLTFSEIIAKWFAVQDRVELLMNFINSWLAEIWQEKVEETKPDQLRKLCRPYKKGTVPDGGIVLTAGIDVQKIAFGIVIRAWGPHPHSWLIREEVATSWEEVEEIIFGTTYNSEALGIKPFGVRLAAIDTGYRTSEAYDFVRKYRQFARAIKGKDQLTGVPYKVTKLEKYPNGVPIPGGLMLWLLDTTFFKDKISYLVQPEKQGCKWNLYEN